MSLSIDSRLSTPVALSANAPGGVVDSSPSTVASSAHETAGAPLDTVKLSLSAHIHLLKSQGQGAKAIAANLGVPTSTVAAYFSAPTSSSSSQPAAAPGAAAVPDVDASSAKAATPAAQSTAQNAAQNTAQSAPVAVPTK